MMLKSDYDQKIHESNLHNIILCVLLLFFTVICCYLFSKKFISPLLKNLERIKKDMLSEEESDIPEFDDLFAFLAERDRVTQNTIHALSQEKQQAWYQFP